MDFSVAERRVKDAVPRARKPPIKSKGKGKFASGKFRRLRVPLRSVHGTVTVSQRPRKCTLTWIGVRRMYSVSLVCTRNRSSCPRSSGELRGIVSVPSYVDGRRFASIGPNKLNTAWTTFKQGSELTAARSCTCGRTCRFKEAGPTVPARVINNYGCDSNLIMHGVDLHRVLGERTRILSGFRHRGEARERFSREGDETMPLESIADLRDDERTFQTVREPS